MYDEDTEEDLMDVNPSDDNNENEADVTVYGADEGDELDVDLDGDSDLEDVDDMEDPDFDDEVESDELEADDAAEVVSQLKDLLAELEELVGSDEGDGEELDLEGDGEDDELDVDLEGEGDELDADLEGEGEEEVEDDEEVKEATSDSAWAGTLQKLEVPANSPGDKQVAPKSSATKAKKLPKHSVDSGESKFTSTEDSVNSIKKGGNATSKLTPPQAKAIMDLVKKYQSQNNQNRQAGDLASAVKLKAMEALNFDMSEEIAKLAQIDESLSDDFLTKLGVIFESAVNTKVEAIAADIELQASLAIAEEIKLLDESYASKIDDYMGYMAENFFEENRIAIQEGVRNELSESFVAGIRSVFAEHYIEVPEGKVNVVEELESTLAERDQKIRKVSRQAVAIRKENIELKREKALAEASFDLSMNEGTKLRKLAESVDFKSADQFASAVADLKEFHFGNATPTTMAEESLVESTEISEHDDMDDVLSVLNFTNR
jgi:hypothetical protein